MVRTEGPDGAPHDYEIAYTFGVAPLQQYLIAFPGGRYLLGDPVRAVRIETAVSLILRRSGKAAAGSVHSSNGDST